MSAVIKTTNLTRQYQTYDKPEGLWNSIRGVWSRKYKNKLALAPTNLEINRGQIVGLVGANGAGKTTLLKMLSGLIYPSSGEALVLGYRPSDRPYELLRKISILLGQKNQLWWDLPARESFELLIRIYDLDREPARKRLMMLADLLKCESLLNTQLRRLSLGERMKMEIIGALLHEPEVLFLDEPTIGLDVVAQTTIRDFLAKYVRENNPTIILTSHYMDDIAKLANRLLLISQGQLVYDGTVQKFIAQTEPLQTLKVKMSEPFSAAQTISHGIEVKAGQIEVQAELKAKDVVSVIAELSKRGTLQELKIEEANFEDVIREFLQTESGAGSIRGH